MLTAHHSSYVLTLLMNLNVSASRIDRPTTPADPQLPTMDFATGQRNQNEDEGAGGRNGPFSFIRSAIRTIREDLTSGPLN
jgi:hypothetical protein